MHFQYSINCNILEHKRHCSYVLFTSVVLGHISISEEKFLKQESPALENFSFFLLPSLPCPFLSSPPSSSSAVLNTALFFTCYISYQNDDDLTQKHINVNTDECLTVFLCCYFFFNISY